MRSSVGCVKGILLCFLVIGAFMSSFSQTRPASAEDFGRYEGTVQTEWIPGDGRRMKLLSRFDYFDPNGVNWDAPAGWIVDGASIPQFAWSFIGGPFEGKYRDASVLHDVACDRKSKPWEDVHLMFYYAMLASNVEGWRAKVMYAAVYHFGPRWSREVPVTASGDGAEIERAVIAAAKSAAAVNSTAVIAGRTKGLSTDTGTDTGGEDASADVELHDYVVRVTPPKDTLDEGDFERLRNQIEAQEKEAPAGGGMTLEEIRAFGAPASQIDESD